MFCFSPSSYNTCALSSQFPLTLRLPISNFIPPPPCLSRLTILSASFRRRTRTRNRRRHNKLTDSATSTATTSSEPKLETIIDLTHLGAQAFSTFHSTFRRYLSSGVDVYADLQTLVTFDDRRRLLVSCRPSTLHFLGTSAVLSFVAFSVFRVLIQLVSRVWSWRRIASRHGPVVVRDRSLGGREVVIGWGDAETKVAKASLNPLSAGQGSVRNDSKRSAKNKVRVERKLPKWWPTVINGSVFDLNEQEEYKREAYRVVRAIVNSRMGGNDIMENDIIQLRQLCRTSGVQVTVEPTNIRDSLYRASVNFVLNVCSRAPAYSTLIDINGEDAQQFLAGFAENIGLENVRAATIVSAAVAARTRSCLLQAWALEMQGKRVDAMAELSKICRLLRIFPPEESSPEMEMVGRGLVKHLKQEQREHLMFLFSKVCGEHSHRIAREALGLMHSQDRCGDQLEDNIV